MYETTETPFKINISQIISKKLGFRDSAADLFRQIEEIQSNIIEIDFSGVQFMSRSFAHEYLQQKQKSEKKIIEINIPENTAKMFQAVLKSIKQPHKLKIEPTRTISLS